MKMNFAVGMNANERMDEIGGHARVAEESGFDFVHDFRTICRILKSS